MLLQLEHEHKDKDQSTQVKQEQVGSPKISKKVEVLEQPSIFFTPQQHHQTVSFNFYTDGLEDLRRQSAEGLPSFVVEFIKGRKRFSEERVYQAIVKTSADFVGIHMRDFRTGLKLQMQAMFEAVHNAVEAGIWDGRYQIDQSRNKYFSLAKKQGELLGIITEQLVRRNLDSFRQELQEDELSLQQPPSEHPRSQHPHSQHSKNRAAQEFVKRMRQEQERHQAEVQRQLQERKLIEQREAQEARLREQRRTKEKKEQVRKRIEVKKELQGMQKERRSKIHSEYLKMVSSLPKPLFQEREQRYNKSVIEDQKRKFKMMQQLKDQKRPISFEEIQQHMRKYEQLLQQNQSFRQQKRELKESQFQILASKKLYRSKFHSLTLSTNNNDQAKTLRTSLIKRQEDYAGHVKRHFLPRTDQAKQQELEELMRKMNTQRRHTFHSRKHIEQGKRNLQKLHLLIAQLRAKNKIKQQPQEPPQPSPPRKYKNYLEEIKQSKATAAESDFEGLLTRKDDDHIRLISLQKQKRAQEKERYLSSSIQDIDIHTHMKGKVAMEQDYIQAAQAKMALLKKYSLEPQAS